MGGVDGGLQDEEGAAAFGHLESEKELVVFAADNLFQKLRMLIQA